MKPYKIATLRDLDQLRPQIWWPDRGYSAHRLKALSINLREGPRGD